MKKEKAHKKKAPFLGVATALVTPFKNGRIDYGAFEKLVEMQIEGGVDALVFCATTGEAPTLCEREKKNVYSFAQKAVGGRVPVICGTSTNSHAVTMRLSYFAAELGVDAFLCVTPYYNKGTENGIKRVFSDVCSLGVPTILYNVPSRTGVDVGAGTISELADLDFLCGVKECMGISRIAELNDVAGDRIYIYSGNDSDFLPSLCVGGSGVISVAANLFPSEIKRIYSSFKAGNVEDAVMVQKSLFRIERLLFCETNPAPIKYALSTKKICENELRLPLAPINEDLCKKIEEEVKKIEQNI